MKLCVRGEKIRADYLKDQESWEWRINTAIETGNSGREEQCRIGLFGSKREMARRLNIHVNRCRECA